MNLCVELCSLLPLRIAVSHRVGSEWLAQGHRQNWCLLTRVGGLVRQDVSLIAVPCCFTSTVIIAAVRIDDAGCLSPGLSLLMGEHQDFSCVAAEFLFCHLQKKPRQICVGGTSDFTAHFSKIQTVNMLLSSLTQSDLTLRFTEQSNRFS